MRILGLTPTSLVDWDGHVSAVLFLGGCNLRCPFCYNGDLARDDPSLSELTWSGLEPVLTRRPGFIDGVVLLGGEPTMHPELFELCRRIRALGLRIKLDTNGCFPYPLKRLIEAGLCDFVAMDMKAPLDPAALKQATGRAVDPEVIRRSIRLLLESGAEGPGSRAGGPGEKGGPASPSGGCAGTPARTQHPARSAGVDYEFRTTLVPGLIGPDQVAAIGAEIRGARCWTLQGYMPTNALSPRFRELPGTKQDDADRLAALAGPFVRQVRLRGKFV